MNKQDMANMSNFTGALVVKVKACDDFLKHPRVVLTFQGEACVSKQEAAIEEDSLVPGTFRINFKERGDTSDSVKIQVYDGDHLKGQC